jgi:uncharacterized protein (TIGR03083 family)
VLSTDSYLAAITRDAALLVDAARLGLEPDVPNCPGWTVADLVEHTGIVHRHKTQIIEEGWLEGAPDPVRPPPRRRLLPWFESGVELLTSALASKTPDQAISTWDAANATVGFWYRRMAHETFIHRIDAEQAHGVTPELDTDLALDGIAEVLTSFIGGAPSWAIVEPSDSYVQLLPSDGADRWNVRLARFGGVSPRTGIEYSDEPMTMLEPMRELDDSSARVSGSAANIDMWLWGRAPKDVLAIEGNISAVVQLRSVAEDSTS